MPNTALSAISPIDGRYFQLTAPLQPFFSESALISYRLKIETLYLIHLSRHQIIRPLTPKETSLLHSFLKLNQTSLNQIKKLEQKTHHDVKAVEYFIRQQIRQTTLKDLIPFLHFGLTSADINNLSYRLMVQDAHHQTLFPSLISILQSLSSLTQTHSSLPMIARTHGQPALPTTLGKEFSVFAARLLHQLQPLKHLQLTGKLNGAVGGYHALHFSFPHINWPQFSSSFITSLRLTPIHNTTQINHPEDLIELFHSYYRLNSILIDLSQDVWRYISDDWLSQKPKKGQVGSSTMPQKINPIAFENAEGNLILANGIFETLARKLPISRLQRDLSESTVTRNIGVAFAHSLIAYHHLNQGLNSISPNRSKITQDLHRNFNILAEALQTHLRQAGNPKAYETTAPKMKGKTITQEDWHKLTQGLDPKIQNLTPKTYLGLSEKLALQTVKQVNRFIKQIS